MSPCLEADRVNRGVHLGLAGNRCDELSQVVTLCQVYRREAYTCRVLKTIGIHIADHHEGRAQYLGGSCRSESYRAGASYVHNGSNPYACVDGAVKAGRQDVGKHCQIPDLLHGLRLVREFDEIEVGVRDHDVFGLSADPPTHVDIAGGSAGPALVDVEANAGLLVATGPAASTSHIERHRDKIAYAQILDIGTSLDDFAGDLVAEHQSGRGCCPPTDHMLIGATDIGSDDFEDYAVIDLFSGRILQLGEINGLNFDFVRS